MEEYVGPVAMAAAHTQTSTPANSAEMSNGLPRNLPCDILQEIILQSFEHAITEDVEYNKRFASAPEYGTTIFPDTSDEDHRSRILKLVLPNNVDDVDYVYGKATQEGQQQYMQWKYTKYAGYCLWPIARHCNGHR